MISPWLDVPGDDPIYPSIGSSTATDPAGYAPDAGGHRWRHSAGSVGRRCGPGERPRLPDLLSHHLAAVLSGAPAADSPGREEFDAIRVDPSGELVHEAPIGNDARVHASFKDICEQTN